MDKCLAIGLGVYPHKDALELVSELVPKRIGQQKQDNSPPFNHLSTPCPDRHHPFRRRMQKKHHRDMALPFGMADDCSGRGTCFQTPVIVVTIRSQIPTNKISRSSFCQE